MWNIKMNTTNIEIISNACIKGLHSSRPPDTKAAVHISAWDEYEEKVNIDRKSGAQGVGNLRGKSFTRTVGGKQLWEKGSMGGQSGESSDKTSIF